MTAKKSDSEKQIAKLKKELEKQKAANKALTSKLTEAKGDIKALKKTIRENNKKKDQTIWLTKEQRQFLADLLEDTSSTNSSSD
jgi:septal ring factor EnvC (AmiA/AmiB activator)